MYLQRLNYLSVSYNITGEYDDITLNAVKTFQVYKFIGLPIRLLGESIGYHA